MFDSVDFSSVKPSVLNAVIILLIVIITVPLAKYAVTKFPIPGLTPLIQAV